MIEASKIGQSPVHDAYLRDAGLSRLDLREAAPLLAGEAALSLQFPGEHCTECAAPDCHESCDLFQRGRVGRCMRFADGIVVVPGGVGPAAYTLEVLFRPWGQLMCVGNAWCMPAARHRAWSRAIPRLGRMSFGLQGVLRFLPPRLHWRLADGIRGLGNRLPRLLNRRASRPGAVKPDALLAVVGNPQREPVRVELSVAGFGASQGGRSVQRTFELAAGWNRVSIPADEFSGIIDLRGLFRFALVPLIEQPALLQIAYFGLVGRLRADTSPGQGRLRADTSPGQGRLRADTSPGQGGQALEAGGKKVKLLVTDLDNTLWDGILMETPDRDFRLFPGVRETLEELDRRGILLSIASKNNADEARAVLQRLGIWDLFLHPQVNWEPKSGNIRRIVEALNLGADSVAFIDDSDFELGEVRAGLPAVRAYHADEFPRLPARPEFDVPVTEESRGRRQSYREEQHRQLEFRDSQLDYDAFLVACDIRLTLDALGPDNAARVYELVQRTNQLNYSGTRYTRADLDRLLAGPGVVPVVMRCEDRYGRYGIVGFAVLRRAADAIEVADLMFSCRIQGKRIEHGFFGFLAGEARRQGLARVVCRFTRTARNAPAARVFEDMSFARDAADGAREMWSLPASPPPRPAPARIVDAMGLPARLPAP